MVEENLQALELLLEREEEMLHQLPTLNPGVEMDGILDKLSGSLQQFQSLLMQLGEADLDSGDNRTVGRLQELKQKREYNVALLQETLRLNTEKMAALHVEKKVLHTYRPAGPKEPRLLDDER